MTNADHRDIGLGPVLDLIHTGYKTLHCYGRTMHETAEYLHRSGLRIPGKSQ
ncbi:MAG: hypothetical protein JW713_10030 [Pontiellaceae bacterium]|nr:hypothetical protein [Pontiellaceae bacterium]